MSRFRHLSALLLAFIPLHANLPASDSGTPFGPLPYSIAEAKETRGKMSNPEAISGDVPQGLFVMKGENSSARLVLDLGEPCELRSLRITTPEGNHHTYLTEASVGSNPHKTRKLLGRGVNLPSWKEGGTIDVTLPPDTVGRYLVLDLSAGYTDGAIGRLEVIGRKNIPERHLLYWAGDLDRDYRAKLEYLANDLGITDIWLDYIETAFPQSNRNASIETLEKSGILQELKKRGIRYWLGEHEGFCSLVNSPEQLRDEARWETTLRNARVIYAKAKVAGFHGLELDAEDYDLVTPEAKKKYADFTGEVTGWSFKEEFGPGGLYYRRGLEFGRMLKEVWDCPLIQLYEARIYADKNDARAGNYWWMKGIYDAGITDISIATEKSYGAGNNEIAKDATCGEHLYRWFIRLPELCDDIRKAYPFARRVIPLFHPWNSRIGAPMYLPKYFQEQVADAAKVTTAFGLYLEGNTSGGDPRDVLKAEKLSPYRITADEYLDVMRKYPAPPKDVSTETHPPKGD
jgi:hypothetical protein